MRGFKSLIVLSMVLAGLAAYVYFVESKKPEESAATAGPKVFAAVKTEAVEEITVKSAGGDRTTLKKAGGTWQITAPVTAPADEAEVSGIVTTLAAVDVVRTVEENATDLAQFGLAEPRVEIEFKDGRRQGDAAPADRRQDGDIGRPVRQAARRQEGLPDRRLLRRHVQPRHVRPAAEERARVRARQGRPGHGAVRHDDD